MFVKLSSLTHSKSTIYQHKPKLNLTILARTPLGSFYTEEKCRLLPDATAQTKQCIQGTALPALHCHAASGEKFPELRVDGLFGWAIGMLFACVWLFLISFLVLFFCFRFFFVEVIKMSVYLTL